MSQTVTAGQTATFSVVASGTAPLRYQWQKGGAAISGATSSSYTTPITTIADTGSQFTVIVSNDAADSVTSAPATLTVTEVPIPCVVSSVVIDPRNVTLTAGDKQPFSAAVHFTGPCNEDIVWSVEGEGTISSSGLYTAPAIVLAPIQATVKATSVADTNKFDSATAMVNPVVITNPTPTISSTTPSVVVPGHVGEWILKVAGAGFVADSTVHVNGGIRTTTFVSDTELRASMFETDSATSGLLAITVVSPAPGGGTSNTATVKVGVTASITEVESFRLTGPPEDLLGAKVKVLKGVFGDGKKALLIAASNAVYLIHDPDNHPGSFTVSQCGSSALPCVKFFYGGLASPGPVFYNIAKDVDVDGDGADDFRISVDRATSDSINKPAAGTIFMIRGGTWLTEQSVVDLNTSRPSILRAEGKNALNVLGWTMADGVDADRDGFGDMAFTAPGAGAASAGGFPDGEVYFMRGKQHLFDLFASQIVDISAIGSQIDGAMWTRNEPVNDDFSGYFLGSAFPGSDTLQFVEYGGEFLLMIGDPHNQNKTPNTQLVYAVFIDPGTRGTFFIEDVGIRYRGVTFFVDTTNACHLGDPLPCYSGFGIVLAGRNGSLLVGAPTPGGLPPGDTLTWGSVFVYTEPLTNGRIIDVRNAVRSLEATSLWDTTSGPPPGSVFEGMGYRLVDGEDVRLVSIPVFDGNCGKLIFVPASDLPRGNLDAASVTTFTIIGERPNDLFSHSLARGEDGSIAVGARSFRNANPGKAYYIPDGAILF